MSINIDYSLFDRVSALPEASSMIESFRAVGYNIETAVADIIDNAITARSKNIWIKRQWNGGKSYISILDDGIGMNNEELIQAMKPGTHNPLNVRNENDLGRFGLGLKTASFSQCRKLTLVSKKKDSKTVYWTWDLDFISECKEWLIIKWMPDEFRGILDNLESGTVVIWNELDRIIPLETNYDDERAKQKFSKSFDKVKKHISMVFHRFIEDKTIKIYWGNNEISPWNPFCINEKKTQEFPEENIKGGAKMKGYILPHRNNFSSNDAYKNAEGIKGYPAQQGFYVYRAKRLLLAGDWLGLFRKEEHYKLVRIRIDFPNNMDNEWQIDIKKSKAYPPLVCMEQLESYAKNVRSIGSEVYRHRGKILKQISGNTFQPLWLEKRKDNKWSFIINRDHLMIQNLKVMSKDKPEQAFDILLKFLEESIPTKTIYINEAQSEEKQKIPFTDVDVDIIKSMLKQMYYNQILQGKTSEVAKEILKTIEPFNNYEDLIEEIL